MIIIVPISRPLQVMHVMTQWLSQTYSRAELCFCPAPGVLDNPRIRGVTVLPPTSTIGDARNTGLAYAKAQGHEWAVFWDDDNYYGPGYIAEIAREQTDFEILSKGLAFVRHDSGLWLYSSRLGFFPGHSTAVRVSVAATFPSQSLAEDVEWSKRMLANGSRAKHLPPWSLVYTRTNPWGHAYDADETEFLRAHGPARFVSADAPDSIVDSPFLCESALEYAKNENVFQSLERRSRLRRVP